MSDEPKRIYCIVGIRPNGTRVEMGCGLTEEEANRSRDALVAANVFTEVRVEVDEARE